VEEERSWIVPVTLPTFDSMALSVTADYSCSNSFDRVYDFRHASSVVDSISVVLRIEVAFVQFQTLDLAKSEMYSSHQCEHDKEYCSNNKKEFEKKRNGS